MKDDLLKLWFENKKKHKALLNADSLFKRLLSGDKTALSSAITLIESKNENDRAEAQILIQKLLPFSGNSIRIGITGVPGVGKSTFIDAFALELIKENKKIAILTIDPSSSINKGSILGDKTRMNRLVTKDQIFIRPSPSGESLGGVSENTKDAIVLLEAFGFDTIIVETVGVGQSEIEVASITDFFLLLMLAGAGDELQGVKRGIMEMADGIVVTKADGSNEKNAQLAASGLKNALHLFLPNENGWIPKVLTCSAMEGKGMEQAYNLIESFERQQKLNGSWFKNRVEQDLIWFEKFINKQVMTTMISKENFKELKTRYKIQIEEGTMTPYLAAELLIKKILTDE